MLSTAAGSGTKQVIKPVKRNLSYWGIPYVKSYGVADQAANWADVKQIKKDKIEARLNKLAKKVKKARIKKPSLYIQF